jgi:hypothetical protein
MSDRLGAVRRLDLGRQAVKIAHGWGMTTDLQSGEKMGVGCGLVWAGNDPDRDVVTSRLFVASKNRPMLGPIQVQLEHNSVRRLDNGTTLTLEYGAESLRRRTMTNKHFVTKSFQELGIGGDLLRQIEKDGAVWLDGHQSPPWSHWNSSRLETKEEKVTFVSQTRRMSDGGCPS